MASEENLLLRPVEVNPVVDGYSDTDYLFVVQDARGVPCDVAAFSAVMELRPYVGAKKVYDTLSTENGRIEANKRGIEVHFPASVTKDYRFDRAVYDLVIVSLDGHRYRVAEGTVSFTPWVTN